VTRAGSFRPFSGRRHRGRLTPRANTDRETTATVSPALNTLQAENLFGGGIGPRRVDPEKDSIGHLEPGHGPDEAPIGGETRQSPSELHSHQHRLACRGGADAPFEAKSVQGEVAVLLGQ
jgi:hypothetical protein